VRLPLVLLAVLTPLALVSPASAALPAGNVIQNGDAEGGTGATNSNETQAPPGWQTLPNFTAVVYGASGGFPDAAIGASIGGGRNFFAGGPPSEFGDATAAVQDIDLTSYLPELDGSGVQATLSADLGGFASQNDSASVTAVLTNAEGNTGTGVLTLAPVTPEERGNATGFLRRTDCVTLQPGTRRAIVQIVAQRIDPAYNDGYADNVSLTLSTAACPAKADAPLPPPTPQPVPGVSANADVSKGRVFVKRPGATKYQELRSERSIPVGSEIDTTRGEINMQTAVGTGGKSQVAKFRDGKFTMEQSKGAKITDLVLTGERFDKCPRTGTQASAAARRPTRRLWGNGKGRYRTRGRYATATVRGTKWMVRDACDSTTVQVARGVVIVRDLVKRKNVRVKAPRSYTARARKR
jgi:hypothetical protein